MWSVSGHAHQFHTPSGTSVYIKSPYPVEFLRSARRGELSSARLVTIAGDSVRRVVNVIFDTSATSCSLQSDRSAHGCAASCSSDSQRQRRMYQYLKMFFLRVLKM